MNKLEHEQHKHSVWIRVLALVAFLVTLVFSIIGAYMAGINSERAANQHNDIYQLEVLKANIEMAQLDTEQEVKLVKLLTKGAN